jgi:hypothetical protein
MNAKEREKRAETINNLLAKAESSTFPEESRAFSSKASELMTKWAIDDAFLNQTKNVNDLNIGVEKITIDFNSYYNGKSILLATIAKYNNIRCCAQPEIYDKLHKTKIKTISIVGSESDRDWTQTLFLSLLTQAAQQTALAWMYSAEEETLMNFRKSFMNGFCEEINSQLADAKERAESDAYKTYGESNVALVLVTKKDAVNDFFQDLFPNLRRTRSGNNGHSAAGKAAGMAAGQNASTSRSSRIGTSVKLLS